MVTLFRRCIPVFVALAACGREAPADAEAFFLEYGEDWCDCAERDLSFDTSELGTEPCPDSVAALVLGLGSDDDCFYDDDRALSCVEITRRAEVTCDDEGGVFYDGVPFEEIEPCDAAWSCARSTATP